MYQSVEFDRLIHLLIDRLIWPVWHGCRPSTIDETYGQPTRPLFLYVYFSQN